MSTVECSMCWEDIPSDEIVMVKGKPSCEGCATDYLKDYGKYAFTDGKVEPCLIDKEKRCVIFTKPESVCGPFLHLYQKDNQTCGYFSINNFLGEDKYDRARAMKMFKYIYSNSKLLKALLMLKDDFLSKDYLLTPLTKMYNKDKLIYDYEDKETFMGYFTHADIALPTMINIASVDLKRQEKGWTIRFSGMLVSGMDELTSLDPRLEVNKILIGDFVIYDVSAHATCARKTLSLCKPNKDIWYLIDSQSTMQKHLDPTDKKYVDKASGSATPIAYFSSYSNELFIADE